MWQLWRTARMAFSTWASSKYIRHELDHAGEPERLADKSCISIDAPAYGILRDRAHDDARDVTLRLAPLHGLNEPGAVEHRHHQVGDDQVGRWFLVQTLQCLASVCRQHHVITPIRQGHRQKLGNRKFVLDDQHRCAAHCRRPSESEGELGPPAAARTGTSRGTPLKTASAPSNGFPMTIPASVIENWRIVESKAPSRTLNTDIERYSRERSST